jgi:Flp pilus assembly protein TadG
MAGISAARADPSPRAGLGPAMARHSQGIGYSALRRLAADQRGNVAIILGLAVIPLFVTLGLAVDGSRGYLVKSKLQDAIDAAGLAGGRALESDNARADIDMFFQQNYPADYLGGQLDAFDVAIDDSARTITLSACPPPSCASPASTP